MSKTKQQAVRYVVNSEAIRALDSKALPSEGQPPGEGYSPVLQTPNFFRRLYGYTVYQKNAKSAF